MKQKFNVEKNPKKMAYVREHDTCNIRCIYCGKPVLRSDFAEEDFKYQCLFCDYNLLTIETYEGEHHTDEEFEELLLRI